MMKDAFTSSNRKNGFGQSSIISTTIKDEQKEKTGDQNIARETKTDRGSGEGMKLEYLLI